MGRTTRVMSSASKITDTTMYSSVLVSLVLGMWGLKSTMKRPAYGKGAPYTACTQYDGSTEGEEVLAMLVRDSIVDRLEAHNQEAYAALLPVLRVCCDANESSVTLYRMKLNSQFCHRLQLVKYLTSMHARPSWLQYLTVWRNWEPLYAPTTTPMLRTASVETGGTVRFSETVGAA